MSALRLDEPKTLPEVTCVVPSLLAGEQHNDGMEEVPSSAAASWAAYLASIFGGEVCAILHYGSRAQGRAVRPDSAFDFLIVVSRYDAAYRVASSVLGERCRPRLATTLARLLPPNAMSVRRNGPTGEEEAKCLIISEHDFRRECSPRARDQFVKARVSQTVIVAWTRDAATTREVLAAIQRAREDTFDWVPVFLPPVFDLPTYCRTLLEVWFSSELRAEAAGYAGVLFAAQRDRLLAIYEPVLVGQTVRGALGREGSGYRQRQLLGWWERWRVRSYLRWSKVRTTVRLLKHPFLYDGWLEYITKKIDRSTGEKITLTAREQRFPLIFLWPRVLRYLRHRPQRSQ